MSAFTYTAQRGLKLLGDEKGAWLADTTEEVITGLELVTDSGFNTPCGANWTCGTGWTIGASVATHAPGAAGELTSTPVVPFIEDQPYVVAFNVGGRTAGSLGVRLGGEKTDLIAASNGIHTGTVLGGSQITFTQIRIWTTPDFDGFVDNVSIRLAVPDLSTNNNGLGVYGSITKSAVVAGAGLVAYSGYNASNYLEQSYNPDFDFGTGDFCAMLWAKSGAGTYQNLLSRSAPTFATNGPYGGNDFSITKVNGPIAFRVGSVIIEVNDVSETEFVHLVMSRVNGVLYAYIDGALVGSAACADTVTDTSAIIRVGRIPDDTWVWPASTAYITLPKVVLGRTAAQIKAIYASEKHLFSKYSTYTQVGESYSIDIKQMSPRPSGSTQQSNTETLSGKRRSIIHHDRREWEIATSLMHRTDGTNYLRRSEFEELMYATRGSESFTYDPYGSVASPDDPVTVVRISNDYDLQPEENTDLYRSGFRVREV